MLVPLVIQHRLGIPSLSAARTKIMQTIHNEQSRKSKAFDLLSGLLNFSRKRCVEIHSTLLIGDNNISLVSRLDKRPFR